MNEPPVSSRRRALIGVWVTGLHSSRPRGLHRVARKVVELFRFRDGVDYVAVTSLSYREGVVYAEICHLGDYLSAVPWRTNDHGSALAVAGVVFSKVPARFLSAVLSFECFDELWNWPIDQIGMKAVCVVHDSLPHRGRRRIRQQDEVLQVPGECSRESDGACLRFASDRSGST
jgi:hypothetical protein